MQIQMRVIEQLVSRIFGVDMEFLNQNKMNVRFVLSSEMMFEIQWLRIS